MKKPVIKVAAFVLALLLILLFTTVDIPAWQSQTAKPDYIPAANTNTGLASAAGDRTISPLQQVPSNGAVRLSQKDSKGYSSDTIYLKKGSSVSFETQSEKGQYTMAADYLIPNESMVETIVSVKVNDSYPFYESRNIKLKGDWKDSTQNYQKDRYGNDVVPQSIWVSKWQNRSFNDNTYYYINNLQFPLNAGKNKITITAETGDVLLGNVFLKAENSTPSYNEYVKQFTGKQNAKDRLITLEAEKYSEKSDSYIRPSAMQDISAYPYDYTRKNLNILSGDSCKDPGQSVTWEFTADQNAFVNITLKYKQNTNNGIPVFKQILIDDQIPFRELSCYPLQYTGNKFENETLSGSGKAFEIYLTKGKHRLTLVSTADAYSKAVSNIQQTVDFISKTSVKIKKITGNSTEKYRDWNISDYIPDLKKSLDECAASLDSQYKDLLKISGNKAPSAVNNMVIAVSKLKQLAEDPDSLPNSLDAFSQASGSVLQLLSDLIPVLTAQPVDIDRIYIGSSGNALLPANKGSLESLLYETQKLFYSFGAPDNSEGNNKDGELNIWVNRPIQYADIMQQMVDSQYKGTKKVNISVMTNVQKLILANASGNSPDVVLGIDSYTPFDISIRGAALDLRQFKDFGKVINDFEPASIVPFVLGDGCYALPETQDFNLLFYRKDILDSLGLKVPQTWDDVVKMLPVLERYGMNFNTQISNVGAFKPMLATSPFIHQFGGEFFSKDGLTSALGSEKAVKGFEFMTDLYTRYSLPTDTPNFYSKFRNGVLPIGVSGFGTYVQLTYAAPEIVGQWAVAPSIGVKNDKGTIERWQTGVSTGNLIFSSTKYKQESWDFLKWWMSTQTQTDFANNLQSKYGPAYIWNSANIQAFKNSPLPQKDKDVILEQWKSVKEVPRNPAYYMSERALSDAWNRVVFNGESPRVSLDKAITEINRETRQKMIEFGYLDEKGKTLKPYIIPDTEKVKSWRE